MLFALSASRALWAADEPFLLKKLLIAESEASVAALPADSGGNEPVFVSNVPVLAGADYKAAMAKFIGQPFTNDLANAIGAATAEFLKKNDRLLYKFYAPTGQNAATGVLRIGVAVGKYGNIQFRNNRYFSSKLLQDKLGVNPGDEIRVSVLENGVNWANANPFRQVKVLLNELADKPGNADLIVGVQERIPLRLTLSVDDAGTQLMGDIRYTAALQYGNLWGRDHQLSYQYTTSDQPGALKSHAVDYRWPLPWHHYIQFSGGYSTVHPFLKDFTFSGENMNAVAKYIYPIRDGNNPVEFSAGLDFKQGNNTILYGALKLPDSDKTNQVIQFTSALSAVYRDKRGAWLLGFNVNAAPGNLTPNNRKSQFTRKDDRGNYVTEVRYLTANVSIQRLLLLPKEWSVFSRLALQVASANLPGSEQLSVGGSGTVRGYNERIETGDEGLVFSNDLQTPTLHTPVPFLKNRPPLASRLAAFYDFGTVSYKFPNGADVRQKPLASAGLGLRMSLGVNFSLNADYGWQLTERAIQLNGLRLDPEDYRSRGHVKVVLAF